VADDGGVLYLVVSGAPAPEGIPALVAACTGQPMVPQGRTGGARRDARDRTAMLRVTGASDLGFGV
jgi:hypothetical protein